MFRFRLKELRENKGLSQYDLANILSISQSTIGNWEAGKREPNFTTMQRIANYFNVSVDYLLGRPQSNIASAYQPESIVHFPVIGSIKAGYDGMIEEYGTGDTIIIPIEMLGGRPPEDYLAFQVRGNSMYPKLIDGDRVLVLRTESVDSGSTAVVCYNGDEATIKKVVYTFGENWLDLVPANPEYETKRISGVDLEQCRIIGKAVKLIRDI